jgi:hypothetical protein
MADVWVVLTIVAFFALCVGFVWACDRIIGSDDQSDFAQMPAEQNGDGEPELAEVGSR